MDQEERLRPHSTRLDVLSLYHFLEQSNNEVKNPSIGEVVLSNALVWKVGENIVGRCKRCFDLAALLEVLEHTDSPIAIQNIFENISLISKFWIPFDVLKSYRAVLSNPLNIRRQIKNIRWAIMTRRKRVILELIRTVNNREDYRLIAGTHLWGQYFKAIFANALDYPDLMRNYWPIWNRPNCDCGEWGCTLGIDTATKIVSGYEQAFGSSHRRTVHFKALVLSYHLLQKDISPQEIVGTCLWYNEGIKRYLKYFECKDMTMEDTVSALLQIPKLAQNILNYEVSTEYRKRLLCTEALDLYKLLYGILTSRATWRDEPLAIEFLKGILDSLALMGKCIEILLIIRAFSSEIMEEGVDWIGLNRIAPVFVYISNEKEKDKVSKYLDCFQSCIKYIGDGKKDEKLWILKQLVKFCSHFYKRWESGFVEDGVICQLTVKIFCALIQFETEIGNHSRVLSLMATVNSTLATNLGSSSSHQENKEYVLTWTRILNVVADLDNKNLNRTPILTKLLEQSLEFTESLVQYLIRMGDYQIFGKVEMDPVAILVKIGLRLSPDQSETLNYLEAFEKKLFDHYEGKIEEVAIGMLVIGERLMAQVQFEGTTVASISFLEGLERNVNKHFKTLWLSSDIEKELLVDRFVGILEKLP